MLSHTITKTFPILTDRKGKNLTINNLLKN